MSVRKDAFNILHKNGWNIKKSMVSLDSKNENECEICPKPADYIMFFKSKKTFNMFSCLVCKNCKKKILTKETEIDMEIKSNKISYTQLLDENQKKKRVMEFKTPVKLLINQCTIPNKFEIIKLDHNTLFNKPIYDTESLDTFIPKMVASRQFNSYEYRIDILRSEFGSRYNIVLYHVDGAKNQNRTYNVIGKIHSFVITDCQQCQYPFSYFSAGARKRCPECVDWTKLYKNEYKTNHLII